jgi:hypothetical protein
MKKHWLYQAGTPRKLWTVGVVVLFITVLVELFFALHPHFRIAKLFAFHAIYGLVSCALMILFAKYLGLFIKRKDDYYDN